MTPNFGKMKGYKMSVDYASYSSDGFESIAVPEIINVVSLEEEKETVEEKVLMGTIYNCDRVYVRSAANKDSEPLTDLHKDNEVLVTGTSNDSENVGWYKVCTATGIEGYIMSKFVKLID